MGVNPLRTLSEQKRSPELKPILVLPTSGVGARRACKLPINRARFNSFAFKRVEAAAVPARGEELQLAAGAGRGRTGGAAGCSSGRVLRGEDLQRATGGRRSGRRRAENRGKKKPSAGCQGKNLPTAERRMPGVAGSGGGAYAGVGPGERLGQAGARAERCLVLQYCGT